ncbi:MAG: hypothetical protein KAJ01_10100 [Candidatus Hydrogenedentes bacterium]|nr:hypothetical protein [Candidatus Hydrogenedentota bacterium]
MGKLSGQYLVVKIDDSGDSPQDVSTDVESIDIPDEYGELDVTGFSDGAVNSIAGMPSFNVEIAGNMNPAANSLYDVLKGIVGKSAKTLTVQVGQGAAPTTGDPEFDGEFWCQKLNISSTPQGKLTVTSSLRPSGSVAPAWGLMT